MGRDAAGLSIMDNQTQPGTHRHLAALALGLGFPLLHQRTVHTGMGEVTIMVVIGGSAGCVKCNNIF